MTRRLLLASVCIAALLYVLSSWLVGQGVEATLDAQMARLRELPNAKLVARQYTRGVLTSRDTTTFELFTDVVQAMRDDENDAGQEVAPIRPIRITVHSEITHGPFPGFSPPAAAVVTSTFELDEPNSAAFDEVFHDQPPLTMRTVLSFDGSGRAVLTSPPSIATWKSDGPDGPTNVNWEGFDADLSFAPDMKSYALRGEAPKLELSDGRALFSMSGLRVDADRQHVLDDEPWLFVGDQKMRLAEMRVNVPADAGGAGSRELAVLVEEVAYDVSMPIDGEFVDVVSSITVEGLEVDGAAYAPAELTFAARHLHLESMAKLQRVVSTLYTEMQTAPTGGDVPAAIAQLLDPVTALLQHRPELHLERFRFRSSQGETHASASFKVNDFKSLDVLHPQLLLPKLEATAELVVPDSLLVGAIEGDEREALLAMLVEAGYIVRENGRTRTRVSMRDGVITLNGKQFNPTALFGQA